MQNDFAIAQFFLSCYSMNIFRKTALLSLPLCAVFCTSGSHSDTTSKKDITKADSIVYTFYDASVAPKYYRGYTISITPDELQVQVKSYDDVLLQKTRDFSQDKFDDIKEKFKSLKKNGEINDEEIPNGGRSQSIEIFKNKRSLFDGRDYGNTKDFKGADIDLSYLVPDIKDLIESTKEKNNDNNN